MHGAKTVADSIATPAASRAVLRDVKQMRCWNCFDPEVRNNPDPKWPPEPKTLGQFTSVENQLLIHRWFQSRCAPLASPSNVAQIHGAHRFCARVGHCGSWVFQRDEATTTLPFLRSDTDHPVLMLMMAHDL